MRTEGSRKGVVRAPLAYKLAYINTSYYPLKWTQTKLYFCTGSVRPGPAGRERTMRAREKTICFHQGKGWNCLWVRRRDDSQIKGEAEEARSRWRKPCQESDIVDKWLDSFLAQRIWTREWTCNCCWGQSSNYIDSCWGEQSKIGSNLAELVEFGFNGRIRPLFSQLNNMK